MRTYSLRPYSSRLGIYYSRRPNNWHSRSLCHNSLVRVRVRGWG